MGILGGTFDPPHIGHLLVARAVGEALALDSVVLMVAGDPWQKTDLGEITPAEDRLAMVRATVLDGTVSATSTGNAASTTTAQTSLEVSDLELRRGGRTYTVDTLEQLRAEDPDRELFLILGADAAAGLDTWHRHDELSGLCQLAVVERPGSPVEVAGEVEHLLVEAPLVDISSSELRKMVARGESVEGLVTPGAISVIEERGLYAGGDDGY